MSIRPNPISIQTPSGLVFCDTTNDVYRVGFGITRYIGNYAEQVQRSFDDLQADERAVTVGKARDTLMELVQRALYADLSSLESYPVRSISIQAPDGGIMWGLCIGCEYVSDEGRPAIPIRPLLTISCTDDDIIIDPDERYKTYMVMAGIWGPHRISLHDPTMMQRIIVAVGEVVRVVAGNAYI